MKCPNCEQVLQITERYNVEIDYCPSCRGVWLDKGELDKMIDLANLQTARALKKEDDDDDHKYKGLDNTENKNNKYGYDKNYPDKNRKKNSFLGDLFDFG